MKKVSAIITTHNRCECLKAAIRSVLNQTYKNIELIIVNDASTDNTEEYLKSIQSDEIQIINIKKEESRGGNHARNKGILAATGYYIAFLDDDDVWLEEKIEKQVKLFEESPDLGLVYCAHIDSYFNGKYQEPVFPDTDLRGNLKKEIFCTTLCTTSMILTTKDVLKKTGMFDECLMYWQDYDLLIRICQLHPIDFVNEPLMVLSHDFSDPGRLSNKIVGWLEAVKKQNMKYNKELSRLSPVEKKKRRIMICSNGWERCEIAHDKKKMRYFALLIWKDTHNIKFLISFFFGIGHVFLIKLKGRLSWLYLKRKKKSHIFPWFY